MTLSFALTRRKWGKPQQTIPSRFLYEMTGQAENFPPAAEANGQAEEADATQQCSTEPPLAQAARRPALLSHRSNGGVASLAASSYYRKLKLENRRQRVKLALFPFSSTRARRRR